MFLYSFQHSFFEVLLTMDSLINEKLLAEGEQIQADESLGENGSILGDRKVKQT